MQITELTHEKAKQLASLYFQDKPETIFNFTYVVVGIGDNNGVEQFYVDDIADLTIVEDSKAMKAVQNGQILIKFFHHRKEAIIVRDCTGNGW